MGAFTCVCELIPGRQSLRLDSSNKRSQQLVVCEGIRQPPERPGRNQSKEAKSKMAIENLLKVPLLTLLMIDAFYVKIVCNKMLFHLLTVLDINS